MTTESLNVLLVAAKGEWQRVCAEVLQQAGHHVEIIEGVGKAERSFRESYYHLIIIDSPFQDERTFSACLRLRNKLKSEIFVVSTWDPTHREIKGMVQLQVHEWIRKSIRRNEVAFCLQYCERLALTRVNEYV